MSRQTFGKAGENTALSYLKKTGYAIIVRNYLTRSGELDIVAFKNGVLVFTEVKTKTDVIRGEPYSMLTEAKKRSLYSSAMQFCNTDARKNKVHARLCGIKMRRRYKAIRFDLLELIINNNKTVRLIHTKNVL